MLFRKSTNEKIENKEKKQMSKETITTENKKEKLTFKDKLKNFIKNKKAVAMVIEYILTIECFTMLFLLTTPTDVKAATFTDESGITWAYTLSNNQATNVYKSGGTLTSTLTIPAYLNEYPVVSIGRNNSSYNILNSTANNTTITEIVLPETLTSIGNYAFYNCAGLTSIVIPNSVTSIGNYTFYNCTGLTSVTIGSSVTSIGNYVFQNCTGITSIEIPNSVTSIGNYVFQNCTGITSIEIPNSVTSIGNSAFYGCTNLISITLGNGVTNIGSNVFQGCICLTGIIVDPNNINYSSENGILYNKEKTILIKCPQAKTGKVTILDSVTSIGNDAFSQCIGLTEIGIPNSVVSIENGGFRGCTGLTKITMPGTTTIGQNAFYNVTNVEEIIITGEGSMIDYQSNSSSQANYYQHTVCYQSRNKIKIITIGNSLTKIGNYAFYQCAELTEIEIPEGVTSIGNYAFNQCSGLTSIEIPNSVIIIGDSAFLGCTGLTSIEIPENVIRIGSHVFQGCIGLTEIEIPDGVTKIAVSTFQGCTGLTEIEIPNSVIYIEQSSFQGCTGLTEIEIPDGVTNIGLYAFRECTGLTKITMPGTASIGENAFYQVTNVEEVILTGEGAIPYYSNSSSDKFSYQKTVWYQSRNKIKSIIIGNSITSIGDYTFYNCTGLTSIEIPSNVTSIGSNAFSGCTSLTSIFVNDNNQIYSSEDGILYNIEKTSLIKCPAGKKGEIIIPSSVTSIGVFAFSGCSGLTSIEIPDSVTSIESYAFQGCTGLTNITIGNSVTTIGSSAFNVCTNLTSVTLGSSVTSIGYYAFSGCTGLTEIEIPNSVTIIGSSAFSGCTGLISVTIGNSVTSIGQSAFYNCTGLTEIEIPNSVTRIENSAFQGCTGLTSVAIRDSVTSIESKAFSDCINLISITLGNSVTRIESNAFSGCTRLTGIEIPNSVTIIGYYAFKGCTGLTSVRIGNSVTMIGNEAFRDCTGLTEIEIPNSVTSIGQSAFQGCIGLTSVRIGNSVTSIGQSAFYNCTGLTEIEIPSSLISIGVGVFHGCTGLTEIEIPNSVTSIGQSAFQGCIGLTKIEIPNSLTSIGTWAFRECTGLTEIEIPNSVTTVGSSAFDGCTGVTKITMPGTIKISGFSGVTNVEEVYLTGDGAMTNYNTSSYQNTPWYISRNKIRNIKIGDGITSIGNYAFYNCTGLTEIEIPNSVMSIGNYAFYNCTGLTEIEIPNNVTSLGTYTFSGCTGLTKITMPGTASIGSSTFNNVTNVEEVILTGGGVIPDYTSSTYTYTPWYQSKNKIKSIIVEEGLIGIGNYTFYDSSDTTDIYIINSQNDVTFGTNWNSNANVYYKHRISKYIDENVDVANIVDELENNLVDIGATYSFYLVNEDEEKITDVNVSINLKDRTEIIDPNEEGIYTIENVNSNIDIIVGSPNNTPYRAEDENGIIWSYIYEDGKATNVYYVSGTLTDTLTIPSYLNNNPVISIGRNLGNFNILNTINNNATIKEIILPSSIEKIFSFAFYNCTGLTEVNIPSNVTSIENNTFYNCTGLIEMDIPSNITSIGNNAFYNCTGLIEVNISSNVTSIGDNAFYNCTSLTKITMPGTASIGSSTFNNVTNVEEVILTGGVIPDYTTSTYLYTPWYLSRNKIKSIKIGNEITVIGKYAFCNCTGLTNIEIPSSVTSIRDYAFYGCARLINIYINNSDSNIAFGSNWNSDAYVHYNNCMHTFKIDNDPGEKLEIEVITDNLTNGKIACGETYKFRLKNKEGNIVYNKTINVLSQGEKASASEITKEISSDENGIYTIENINRDIMIYTGRKPYEKYQFEDENGIKWEYIYENEKARALKYVSGDLSNIEIIEVPEKMDGLIITTLADEAFKGTNVKNVILPDNIINIGESCFEGCTVLKTVVLPVDLRLISNLAFKGCTLLEQVELPENLVAIGNQCFSGCTNLRMDLELKNKLRGIGEEAFSGCYNLTGELILPQSLVQIGRRAFYECNQINKVTILPYEEEVEQINISGFSNSNSNSNTTFSVKENTDLSIFDDLKGLQDIEIHGVVILEKTVTIGEEVFSGCSNLKEIDIQAKVNKIERKIFTGCNNLTDIYINNEEEKVEIETGINAHIHYSDCTHSIDVTLNDYLHLEEITNIVTDNKIECREDYSFHILNKNNEIVKNLPITLTIEGNTIELTPDEDGVYTIENINRNIAISVNTEDTIDPELEITGNTEEWTAEDVVLTIEATDSLSGIASATVNGTEIELTNGEGTYTVSENGSYEVIVTDNVGNTTSETVEVDKIDKVDPELEITGNVSSWTKENVTLTITSSDSLSGIASVKVNNESVTLTNGEGIYTVSENGSYEVIATDNAGNTTSETVEVDKIDKVDPELEITGNAEEWTAEDVVLTIEATDSLSGIASATVNGTEIELTNGEGTYTVSENGSYEVIVTDNVGNTTSETVEVDKIDKVDPELEITGNVSSWTKENVTLTITSSDSLSGIASVKVNNESVTLTNGEGIYTVSENGSYEVIATDNAGNTTSETVEVDKIDKVDPELEITGNAEEWTAEDVVLTIEATDSLSGIASVTVNETEVELTNGEGTYTVSENGSYEVIVTDNVGNTTSETVEVDKIDKVDPELEITGNVSSWTKENVTLTITSSDSLSGIASVKVNNESVTLTNGEGIYTVSENGSYEVIATDNAGNTTSETVEVDKIDKVDPELEITGNTEEWTAEDVVLTIISSDSLSGIASVTVNETEVELTNGEGTYTVSENGSYEVIVTDNVGNTTSETVEVDKIDKVDPELEITGNAEEWTAEDVVLAIEATDSLSGIASVKVNNESVTLTNGVGTYTVSENGSYEVVVTDNVGNTTSETVEVDKIDKVDPELEITGNVSSWTKENVTLTITSSDNLSGIASVKVNNEIITLTNGVGTYTVNENGSYEVIVTDNVGNTTSETVEVDKIDKTTKEDEKNKSSKVNTEEKVEEVFEKNEENIEEKGQKSDTIPNKIIKGNATEQVIQKAVIAAVGIGALSAGAYVFIIGKK